MPSKASLVLLQKIASKVNAEPDEIENAYPCTTLQAALLAANLQRIGSYVSTFVFDISASQHQPQKVKRAFENLYDRTPILRTRLLQSKGSFLQVVTALPLAWSQYDSLDHFCETDSKQTLQLGDALASFAWVSTADNKVYMIWSLHHALYDEWSINLLFADLSLLLTAPHKFKARPNFSRFVKAQSFVDQDASKNFWREYFAGIENHKGLVDSAILVETCAEKKLSGPLKLTQSKHQFSTVAIAAWSLLVAKLLKSEMVVFGNIVNGRTANIPGIADICGPTMTTAPYVVKLSNDEVASSFLNRLEMDRNNMLPYEQSGLAEYRQVTGSGRFDTLLSIRSAQSTSSEAESNHDFLPSTAMGRQVRHPCCIYLDVDFREGSCDLKASFDEHYIDSEGIADTLKSFLTCLQKLSNVTDVRVAEVMESLSLPNLVRANNGSETLVTNDEHEIQIDGKILEVVQKVAQEISPLHDNLTVESGTSLRELGLDSLSTVVFARQLGEALKLSVPFREVTGLRKTVSDVARSLQKILHGTDQAQASNLDLLGLAEQYVEDLKLPEQPPSQVNTSRTILLTGANGYVGIEILRQLLADCDDHLILLVRCDTVDAGMRRIHESAQIAQWRQEDLSKLDERVEIWSSDLAADRLGLDDGQMNRLGTVSTIVHNGARVDFSLDYHDLSATNVSATAFLLSHHLKSVADPSFVYVTGGRGCPLDSRELLEVTASRLASAGGYAQTKFVSEVLVHRAQDLCREAGRSSALTIVHPGAIIGSSGAGIANTDDFLWRYVAASIQMRVYVPAVPTKREWINVMPVDDVAREAVSAALRSESTDKVDRRLMRSGLSVARFWDIIVNKLGSRYELQRVSEWEWLRRLEISLDEQGARHPLFSLSQLLLQGSLKGIGGMGLRPEQMPRDNDMLAAEKAIVSNLDYLEEIGFLSGDADGGKVKVFERNKR